MEKLRTIEMQRLTVEEFREAEKLPLIVVLDDVRSMHNVVLSVLSQSIFAELLLRLRVLKSIRLP